MCLFFARQVLQYSDRTRTRQIHRTSGANNLDALATRPCAKFAEIKLRHTYKGTHGNITPGGGGGGGKLKKVDRPISRSYTKKFKLVFKRIITLLVRSV